MQATFDVESHGQCDKRVLSNRLIIRLHVNEERFLIRQVIIVLQLIIDFDWVAICLIQRRHIYLLLVSHPRHSATLVLRLLGLVIFDGFVGAGVG